VVLTMGAAAALAMAVLAGCSSQGTARIPAKSAVPSAPSATSAVPGDPRTQILDAYTGMWHAYATAARTADYQPGALSQYAAGDALMILTRSLYDNHQHGVVLHGAPVLHPRVTGLTPAGNPDSSAVTDCANDSRWLQYTTAGKPAGGAPAGRHRIYAQLRLFSSVWKVTNLVVGKAGTC